MNDWDELDKRFGGAPAQPSGSATPDGWDALDTKHSGLAKLARTAPEPAQASQDNFSGNLEIGTPWGNLRTGIPMPSAVNRRLAQLGSGFTDLSLGVRQLLSSDKPSKLADLVTGQTADARLRQEAAEKRQSDAALNDDFAGKALNFVGKVGPTLVAPVGWARAAGVAGPIIEGAVLGGASAGLEPVAGNESRAVNAALGAAGGAAIPAALAGARALAKPAADNTLQLAEKYGVPVGISDASTSKLVKAARSVLNDLPLVGSIGARQDEIKQQAFNRAVGDTFGAAAPKLTPDVVDAAKKRMGAEFDRIWSGNTLEVDSQLVQRLQRLQAVAADMPKAEGAAVNAKINDFLSKAQPGQNGTPMVSGEAANYFQQWLRQQAAGKQGFAQESITDLRRGILEAFNRSVSPADAAALTLNRAQYKAFKTVEPLLDKGATGVAGLGVGDIPAAQLSGVVQRSYKGLSSQTSQPALADLARVGSRFMADRTAQTGGSPRAMIQNGMIGSALGLGGYANPSAALVGVPAAAAAQYALGSPAVRKLLTDSQVSRGLLGDPLSVRLGPMLLDAAKNGASAAPALATRGLLDF